MAERNRPLDRLRPLFGPALCSVQARDPSIGIIRPRRHTMSTQTDDRVAALTGLFAAFDRGDIDGYLEYLAPDASLRFGNAEPIHGREAIKESLREFSKVFNWVRHDH